MSNAGKTIKEILADKNNKKKNNNVAFSKPRNDKGEFISPNCELKKTYKVRSQDE